MHRLSIDEGWQWLAGAPAALLRLRPGGSGVLNYVDAATSQFLVRRGTWMGASTPRRVEPAVVLVLPRLPPRALRARATAPTLTADYPSYAAEIAALTRDEPVGRMR